MHRVQTISDIISNPKKIEEIDAEHAQQLLAQIASIQPLLMVKAFKASGRPNAIPDELLTVDQACARLKCEKNWLYKKAKELPFTKMLGERQLRFSSKGIERYIANQ